MMGKKPGSTGSTGRRAGNTVRWEVSSARRLPPERPPDSASVSGSTPDSDVWGGDSTSTSSQSLPPSTSSPTPSPDPFDLFGTVEHTQKPKSTPTSKKQNPFHPKYDPLSNIWAEDEEPHFW